MSVCLYDNYSDPSKCEVCNVPFKLSNIFERDDYVIYAWNTNPDGTGTSYKLGEEFTSEDTSNLYAQWKPIPAYRIPIYGCIQGIDKDSFTVNEDSKEFSPIVINGSNELFRDTNGYVVPFKYSTVGTIGTDEDMVCINCNSIFCESDWSTCFNGRYHIYDGDLPYIDIQLLCQSSSGYKLPTNMIPYDTVSVDSNTGAIATDDGGDNSVTADNLCNALNNLVSYLKTNSVSGDKNFWIEQVQVTK